MNLEVWPQKKNLVFLVDDIEAGKNLCDDDTQKFAPLIPRWL